MSKKERLIGAVARNEGEGLYSAERVELKKSFKKKSTVCWMFCSNHNRYYEIDSGYADWLLKQSGAKKPDDWSEYYFETQNICRYCLIDKERKIQLKKI